MEAGDLLEVSFRKRDRIPKNRSFSYLSGAAISGNATLANTIIGNNATLANTIIRNKATLANTIIGNSAHLANTIIGNGTLGEDLPNRDSPKGFRKIASLPNLLNSETASSSCSLEEAQMAGGAAGEDRVQAVCSDKNGWLFCGIYDGFNGRDAADFLAETFYQAVSVLIGTINWERGDVNYQQEVVSSLQNALNQAENEYLSMVENEMGRRPDLVSIGSCVLVGLLHGPDLFVLNLGDSKAVLATCQEGTITAIQLTETHTVDNFEEKERLAADHPDDRSTIVSGRVKGKLKVTRAFGVGYLKRRAMNDALMGILRVRNLVSPPYISTEAGSFVHRVTKSDLFVIFGSDGLFDFFTNEEAVVIVHGYVASTPNGDPAKFLLENLVKRAASRAGFSERELLNIPAGIRRKYHDDVTVIVVVFGSKQRTSKASTHTDTE